MTATQSPESSTLTPELAASLLRLAPAEKRRAIELLGDDGDASPAESAAFWTDMKMRIDDARIGKAKTYSLDESLAHIDAVFGTGGES